MAKGATILQFHCKIHTIQCGALRFFFSRCSHSMGKILKKDFFSKFFIFFFFTYCQLAFYFEFTVKFFMPFSYIPIRIWLHFYTSYISHLQWNRVMIFCTILSSRRDFWETDLFVCKYAYTNIIYTLTRCWCVLPYELWKEKKKIRRMSGSAHLDNFTERKTEKESEARERTIQTHLILLLESRMAGEICALSRRSI